VSGTAKRRRNHAGNSGTRRRPASHRRRRPTDHGGFRTGERESGWYNSPDLGSWPVVSDALLRRSRLVTRRAPWQRRDRCNSGAGSAIDVAERDQRTRQRHTSIRPRRPHRASKCAGTRTSRIANNSPSGALPREGSTSGRQGGACPDDPNRSTDGIRPVSGSVVESRRARGATSVVVKSDHIRARQSSRAAEPRPGERAGAVCRS